MTSRFGTLTDKEEDDRAVFPRWEVVYECVLPSNWGAKLGDEQVLSFSSYLPVEFANAAPSGWEIRNIRRIYLPDR